MKDHNSSKTDFESEGLAFGAGVMSESSRMNKPKQKRETIFIKLHPKPAAPRHGVGMKQQSKFGTA
jgi:hypothetical protein